MIRTLIIIFTLFWALPAAAVQLELPTNARLTAERISEPDSYAFPVGVFQDGTLPTKTFGGKISRQAWRLDGQAATTLQILDPLLIQLANAGFRTLLECSSQACGGFDFRFATEVLPPPGMYVDIRDYRFVSAARGPPGTPDEVITLLVTRTRAAGYIQIIRAGSGGLASAATVAARSGGDAAYRVQSSGDLASELATQGHVILHDLKFKTGTSGLSPGNYASLEALAGFLKSNPRINIALVGHTDSRGALAANISLSKRRAASVLDRLVKDHGIPPAQLQAEGMGYLAPVASNLSQSGRELNRRVEAILLSAE